MEDQRMEKYEIYCTAEQTAKAIELGVPVQQYFYNQTEKDALRPVDLPKGELFYATIPTAAQMIGWLEEQDEICEVNVGMVSTEKKTNNWSFAIYIFVSKQDYDVIIAPKEYFDRKEATLAAIDAALEYLSNIKK